MHVFISWSGERSKFVAESLRGWIELVLQASRPWMSEEDIGSGSRWSSEIFASLQSSSIGIICMTPENLSSPWLNFEAGAISKSIESSKVIPLLIDMNKAQLSGPMSQFQAVLLNKEGIFSIIKAINKELSFTKAGLPEGNLSEVYDVWWPRLEQKLLEMPKPASPTQRRSAESIMEEILENTRDTKRREEERLRFVQEHDSEMRKIVDKLSGPTGIFTDPEKFISAVSNSQSINIPSQLRKILANSLHDTSQKLGIGDIADAQQDLARLIEVGMNDTNKRLLELGNDTTAPSKREGDA